MKKRKGQKEKRNLKRVLKCLAVCLCLALCFFSVSPSQLFAEGNSVITVDEPGHDYGAVNSYDPNSETVDEPSPSVLVDPYASFMSNQSVSGTSNSESVVIVASENPQNASDPSTLSLSAPVGTENPNNQPPIIDPERTAQIIDQIISELYATHPKETEQMVSYMESENFGQVTMLMESNPNFSRSLKELTCKFDPRGQVFPRIPASASSSGAANDRANSQGNQPSEWEPYLKPIFNRIQSAMNDLGPSSTALPANDLLKNFSAEAGDFIRKTLTEANENLRDAALSLPFEKAAFAAEIVPFDKAVEASFSLELPIDAYIQGRMNQYQTLDSVYVGRDFLRTQKLLNPPKELHPYLKWLLYTRRLTPQAVDRYLEVRNKILALFRIAKEGRGSIRYRGKVYGAFLPFAENATGNYELVQPVPAVKS